MANCVESKHAWLKNQLLEQKEYLEKRIKDFDRIINGPGHHIDIQNAYIGRKIEAEYTIEWIKKLLITCGED